MVLNIHVERYLSHLPIDHGLVPEFPSNQGMSLVLQIVLVRMTL